MQTSRITVTANQAFQSLNENIAFFANADGITLQYSADGINYTQYSGDAIASGSTVVVKSKPGMYFKIGGISGEIVVSL